MLLRRRAHGAPLTVQQALELVQQRQRDELAVINRDDLPLSTRLRMLADAKQLTVGALLVAASCALDANR